VVPRWYWAVRYGTGLHWQKLCGTGLCWATLRGTRGPGVCGEARPPVEDQWRMPHPTPCIVLQHCQQLSPCTQRVCRCTVHPARSGLRGGPDVGSLPQPRMLLPHGFYACIGLLPRAYAPATYTPLVGSLETSAAATTCAPWPAQA
jgi:hypothetical protein